MRSRLIAAGLATVSVVLLGGCSGADPTLEAMRSDPLVTADVPGLTEAQLFGQGGFTSLGKRQDATLLRLFSTPTKKVTAVDLRAAAEIAGAEGWRLRPGESGTWTGSKRVKGRTIDLSIRRAHAYTPVRLAIVLTART